MSRPRNPLKTTVPAVRGRRQRLRLVLWLGALAVFAVLAYPNRGAQTATVLLPPLSTEESPGPGVQAIQKNNAPEEGPQPKALEILLDLPQPSQVFRVESEAAFRDRLRREAEQSKMPIAFPKDTAATSARAGSRAGPFPPRTVLLVPSVVCYRPLYFEDKNTERYGWNVPGLQPFISAGNFYWRTLMLPYSLATQSPWSWECNAGYPLPGDPVPYAPYLVPPSWMSKLP